MVPLTQYTTMMRLMKDLNYPIILVSRVGLGAINHALLSIRALRAAELELMGIVFNQTEPANPEDRFIEVDNPKTIARFGRVKVLGNMGHVDMQSRPEEIWRHFEECMPGLQGILGILKGRE
jgi:dethiobiotin synthetase